jgi:hypothetical protein
MSTDLKIISTFQPSLNQCLISKKYFSEALPEYSHLSLPPGFNVSNYDTPVFQDTKMSSTLSEQLFTKLINNLDPDADIEIKKYGNNKKKTKKNKEKKNNKKKSKKK